jgi:hypothetical protein
MSRNSSGFSQSSRAGKSGQLITALGSFTIFVGCPERPLVGLKLPPRATGVMGSFVPGLAFPRYLGANNYL